MSVVVIIAIIIIVLIIVSKNKNKKESINNKRQAMPFIEIDHSVMAPNKDTIDNTFKCLDVIEDNLKELTLVPSVGHVGIILIECENNWVHLCLNLNENAYALLNPPKLNNLLNASKECYGRCYIFDFYGLIKGNAKLFTVQLKNMITNKYPYANVYLELSDGNYGNKITISIRNLTFERR